jgi:hypothetical protein
VINGENDQIEGSASGTSGIEGSEAMQGLPMAKGCRS